MPVLISQDQILAMPGQAISATVWVENDTGAHGTFYLAVEPADPNLAGDWYTCTISPHAGQNIPANHREPFKVVLTPKRSPHGRSELVEFQVRATNARVTATQSQVRTPAAPQRADDDLLGALQDAISGKATIPSEVPSSPSVSLDDIYGGFTPSPDPEPIPTAAPAPEIPLYTPPAPEQLIELTGYHGANVDIRIRPKNAAPSSGTATAPGSSPAADGGVRTGLMGTLYLYVPPVPSFDVVISPYQPDKKKRAAGSDGKRPIVSGREQGHFAVQVANTESFPASFRLEPVGDDGSQYDLVEQYLHVPPGATEETVLTVRPLALSWWRWTHPYGFRVRTTPLTGAGALDSGAAIERPGVFRQTCAWLHPAPLLALLLLLLTPALFGKPTISQFNPETRIVLREAIDFREASTAQPRRIYNETAARQAAAEQGIGDGGRARFSWKVGGSSKLRLEYQGLTTRDKTWKEIPLDSEAVRKGQVSVPLDAGGNTDYATFAYRLVATGWLPFLETRSVEQQIQLAPTQRASIAFTDVGSEDPRTARLAAGGTRAIVRIKNTFTGHDILRPTIWTHLDDPQHLALDGTHNPSEVFPRSDALPWTVRITDGGDGKAHLVTLFTNATNGKVWQYWIPASNR